jgi:chemotaxis protein CheD
MSSVYDTKIFPGLNDPNMVEVHVGEFAIAQYPRFLMTPALGSCVGVALWDPALKQGGLAHIMLPSALETRASGTEHRFASFAIPEMVRLLHEAGSPRRRLAAKVAGGSTMFRADSSIASIGPRNVAEVKRQLELLKIPLLAEDTGERHARTVEFMLDTGALLVRSYVYGVKRL